jgi:hypothetical protein
MNSPLANAPHSPVCPGAPTLGPKARIVHLGATPTGGQTAVRELFPLQLPHNLLTASPPSVGQANLRAALGITTADVQQARRMQAELASVRA